MGRCVVSCTPAIYNRPCCESAEMLVVVFSAESRYNCASGSYCEVNLGDLVVALLLASIPELALVLDEFSKNT